MQRRSKFMTKQIKGVTVEELTIGDEYLFEEILLRNKEITKQLIETLLGIPDISDIKYISVEDVHHNTHKNKGIRIDVYIKSQAGVAYIVELQRKDTKEIEKRMRYYQAVSDSRQLPTGHPYKDLKDSYVIFICREDIFGKGLYKYSFENTCLELEGLKLNDGAYKIVFNTQGTKGEVCKSSLAFLNLVEGISSDDPLVKKIEAAAEKIKADEMWREAYMQSLLRDQDKFDSGFDSGFCSGFDSGVEQGESRKEIQIAVKMIKRGDSTKEIIEITDLPEQEIEKLKERLTNN